MELVKQGKTHLLLSVNRVTPIALLSMRGNDMFHRATSAAKCRSTRAQTILINVATVALLDSESRAALRASPAMSMGIGVGVALRMMLRVRLLAVGVAVAVSSTVPSNVRSISRQRSLASH